MKTFESFVNKSEYEILCVRLDTYEDGVKVQKLCFDNEIYWSNRYKDDAMTSFGEILDGEHIDNYLYIKMLEGQERLYRSTDYDEDFMKQFKHPNRVFTIRNFREVEGILKYGRIAPSYAPRKIVRESIDWNERYNTLSNEIKKRGIIIYVTPSSRMDALRFLDAINKSMKLEQNKNKLEYSFAKSYTIENWYDDPKDEQRLYFTFVTNTNTKRLEINITTGDDTWPVRYPEWFISTSERELISRLFGIIITPSYAPRKINRDDI